MSVGTFEELYADNVVFINKHEGRYLLPHTLERDYDANAKRLYRVNRGALSMEMHMADDNETIASCTLILTAPMGLTLGTVVYNDFATAGYHCYAMLMAFHPGAAPEDRLSIVDEVNWGLKQYGGTYQTHVGDYTVSSKTENNVATIIISNELLMPASTPAPAETPDDAPDEGNTEDDGSYIG